MPTPSIDRKKLNKLKRYLAKPRTIAEITTLIGFSERTAYRWLIYAGPDIVYTRNKLGAHAYQMRGALVRG
jgi:hypothetical protein